MTSEADILQGIDEMSAYALAYAADCAAPDTLESEGARFLLRTRDSLTEYVRWEIENNGATFTEYINSSHAEDAAHVIADGAVPIYTHERMRTFVDVAAYREDEEAQELCDGSETMEERAGAALYVIASRLVRTLLGDMQRAADAIEDDER